MKAVKKLLHAAYQPVRRAIVKPIENSRAYGRFFDGIIKPLRRTVRSLVKRLLLGLGFFERRVIVRVDGGLGNQMIEYSLGRRVELSCGLPVYYDLAWFKRDGMDVHKRLNRNFDLESVFPGIKLRRAGYFTSFIYSQFFKINAGSGADSEEFVIRSRNPRYLDGLCWKYRDDGMVRDDFVFGAPLSDADRSILSAIEGEDCAVAVHVRRGDFIGTFLEVTTPRYFREAVRLVTENESPNRPAFFVFSDGMDWCRELFGDLDERIVYAGNNDNDRGAADLFLMSRCHHFILSNSTFGYWASFLSDRTPDKLIITPSREAVSRGKAAGKLSGQITISVE
jgi:hypothetical protein